MKINLSCRPIAGRCESCCMHKNKNTTHRNNFIHKSFDSSRSGKAPAARHVLETFSRHLGIYSKATWIQSTGDPELFALFHTGRKSIFPMAASGQSTSNTAPLFNDRICTSSSPRQLQTVSGCCLCRARCSGGIWGFLSFIPSLSCYCILSIVSMRDLLSPGCHTSWPAAKKVSGRESCHSH